MKAHLFACLMGLGAFGVCEPNLPGEYAPDFSKAPAGGGAARGFFQGQLHLGPDHTFYLPSIQMEGFWRIHEGRLVLTYKGFFGMTYAEPDAVLKQAWPTSPMQGHVMDILPDGSLRLKEFGRSKGPVFFRKVPRRSTLELVGKSMLEDSPESNLAWIILWDEAPARWKELLAILQNPKAKYSDRSVALSSLRKTGGTECGKAVLDSLEKLNAGGLTDKQAASFRRRLAQKVVEFGRPELIGRLIEVAPKLGTASTTLAKGIANAKYLAGVPLLEGMLRSNVAEERAAACDAIATMGAKSALEQVRPLRVDPEARVKVSANAVIARLSDDGEEKTAAIRALMGLWDSWNFANGRILQALGESGSKLALPYLVNTLENGKDDMDRSQAARCLGDLGFKETVPALRKALEVPGPVKKPRTSVEAADALKGAMNFAMDNDRVRKAAAEALWKLGAWGKSPRSKEPATGSK